MNGSTTMIDTVELEIISKLSGDDAEVFEGNLDELIKWGLVRKKEILPVLDSAIRLLVHEFNVEAINRSVNECFQR